VKVKAEGASSCCGKKVETVVIQDMRFKGELGRARVEGEPDQQEPSAALNYLAWRRSGMTYAFNAAILSLVFNLLGYFTTAASQAIISDICEDLQCVPGVPRATQGTVHATTPRGLLSCTTPPYRKTANKNTHTPRWCRYSDSY